MRVYDYYIIISESKDKCMHKLVERKKQHDTHTKHTHKRTLRERKYIGMASSEWQGTRYKVADTRYKCMHKATKRAAN